MIEKCFLRDGCPGRTASCSSCQPTDDGCPIYRWFRNLFFEKETMTVKNIQFDVGIGGCPKCGYTLSTFMNYCPKCGQHVKWKEG